MKKIKPTPGNVLVELIPLPTQTPGGLYLPEAAKEEPVKANVLAVGEGKLCSNGKRMTPLVAVGDVVAILQYGGRAITVEGKEYIIIEERDILVKLEEE